MHPFPLVRLVMGSAAVFLLSLFPLCSVAQSAERGVPLSLAQKRAGNVSQVEYRIGFRVPSVKTEPLSAQADIRFLLRSNSDVLLDYEGSDPEGEMAIEVNGRKRKAQFRDGHIVVKQQWLQRGSNRVTFRFIPSDKALNRHDDYLYTLFVPGNAHTAFPCFDQPDLKARFVLSLDLPAGWTAQGNGAMTSTTTATGTVHCDFAQTDPLPTYLFSFTAGMFSRYKADEAEVGYPFDILYRETDPQKVAQLPQVAAMIGKTLRWMEQYTGIKQPFSKVGFVVLPSYQFGGMEHPGTIQLTDRRIFLNPQPTVDEQLSRFNLLAHEVSHLWFGDLVTMRWFDDVWTKEVFANFMADKMCAEAFPDVDHALNFLKNHYPPAMAVDCTDGTHPIQQPLDNLKDAGLVYGNIIYHKAPIVMRKLEETMGAVRFRQGLQTYLQRFSYCNATWDDLIRILDREAPECHLPQFSHVWVKEKGLPMIYTSVQEHYIQVGQGGMQAPQYELHASQEAPSTKELVWPQQLTVRVDYGEAPDSQASGIDTVRLMMNSRYVSVPLRGAPKSVVVNPEGDCYARFHNYEPMLLSMLASANAVERYAGVLRLYDDFVQQLTEPGISVRAQHLCDILTTALRQEENALVASQLCTTLGVLLGETEADGRKTMEKELWTLSHQHPVRSVRQQLRRLIAHRATTDEIVSAVYALWHTQGDSLLSRRDYTTVSWHLAVEQPERWEEILRVQRARLTNVDELREFDFVSRGCHPDPSVRRSLFSELLTAEGRHVETWAERLLSLLNSEAFTQYSVEYIAAGLEALESVQAQGSIFFASHWLSSLLSNHRSAAAQRAVEQFIGSHPDYPLSLMNKVKAASYQLRLRAVQ